VPEVCNVYLTRTCHLSPVGEGINPDPVFALELIGWLGGGVRSGYIIIQTAILQGDGSPALDFVFGILLWQQSMAP
jgi:hypothetical protein